MGVFKLKSNGKTVRVTKRNYDSYFVEVNEITLHRNATMTVVVNFLLEQ